jgi:5-methylcytosine-specific restriction protein B
MESKEPISLYSGNQRGDENGRLISDQIILPPNLFFVGTVNIDETTYMFSPKVLDRANTIEFRIDKTDLINFFDSEVVADAQPIDTIGQTYTKDFMEFVSTKNDSSAYHKELLNFFKALQNVGAEFGYRTASEMERLIFLLDKLTLKSTEKALDVAVMQKLLPKLHGSRSKLNKTLPILASFCLISQDENIAKSLLDEFKKQASLNEENLKKIKLPLSFAKIARMYSSAQENGFASYAEG